jgi:hypothetical protein
MDESGIDGAHGSVIMDIKVHLLSIPRIGP